MADYISAPTYPVYVISKGRARHGPPTSVVLSRYGVAHYLVIEPQEQEAYEAAINRLSQTEGIASTATLRLLPSANYGGGCSIPARNWCWDDALSGGHERHWLLDDNILRFGYGVGRSRKYNVNPLIHFTAGEQIPRIYDRVAMIGFSESHFAVVGRVYIRINVHVYSFMLLDCSVPFRWRGRYNEDTDLCLQVITGGWYTVQFSRLHFNKPRPGEMSGGNTDVLYQGDGRMHMSRELEARWPGIVHTIKRFGRTQHMINWRALYKPPIRLDGAADDELSVGTDGG